MRGRYLIGLLVLIAGCGGVGQAMQYDSTVHYVQMPDDTYRVFEHPKHDRIMTTPSLNRIAGQGLQQGLTLGTTAPRTPEQLHEAAARKYLDDTGRSDCPITNSRVIVDPQYEFTFDCSKHVAKQSPAAGVE